MKWSDDPDPPKVISKMYTSGDFVLRGAVEMVQRASSVEAGECQGFFKVDEPPTP